MVANSLWILGWAVLISVFKRRGDAIAKLFVVQMFVKGAVTSILAPVGMSAAKDNIHFIAAATYMLDHHFMFSFLNTKVSSRFGFELRELTLASSVL